MIRSIQSEVMYPWVYTELQKQGGALAAIADSVRDKIRYNATKSKVVFFYFYLDRNLRAGCREPIGSIALSTYGLETGEIVLKVHFYAIMRRGKVLPGRIGRAIKEKISLFGREQGYHYVEFPCSNSASHKKDLGVFKLTVSKPKFCGMSLLRYLVRAADFESNP